MLDAAKNARHVILGTATPIQTDVQELWDLLEILGQGADHVLGRRSASRWRDAGRILPLMTGEKTIARGDEGWDLIRNPVPPAQEDGLFGQVRQDLALGIAVLHRSAPRGPAS
jgi:hypothetical protein